MNRKLLVASLIALCLGLAAVLAGSDRAATQPIATTKQEDQLDRRIQELRLEDVTLSAALHRIAELSNANIAFNERVLESYGESDKIYVRLHNCTVRKALDIVLAAGFQDEQVSFFETGEHVIYIGQSYGWLETRVYDIRDLVDSTRQYLHEHGSAAADLSYDEVVGKIMALIHDGIEPDSWTNGPGWIRELAGRLIISASSSVHAKVQSLLGDLRARNQSVEKNRD